MSFTLRSGPFIDRWRGWISGNVVIKLRRQEPAKSVDLPDVDSRIDSQVALPLPATLSPEQLEGAKLQLTRSETGKTVELEPGDTATLDDVDVAARIDTSTVIVTARTRSQ
jgi:hypothetical protein